MGNQFSLADIAKFRPTLAHAEGRFQIDLTDPITGKVLDRIEERNHIFESLFFSSLVASGTDYNNYSWEWEYKISNAMLLLTDSEYPISDDMPYILGEIVGLGVPNNTAMGSKRGNYNPQAQQLAVVDREKVHWKFQYEFTASQANGKIATIGLSHQLNPYPLAINSRPKVPKTDIFIGYISDGKYAYGTSSKEKIVKYDLYDGTFTEIQPVNLVDVQAIKNTSNYSRSIGYNPSNKHYYIITSVWNSPYTHWLQEYSDNTFSNLLETYEYVLPTYFSSGLLPYYVYGDYLFMPLDNASEKRSYIYRINYKTSVYDIIYIYSLAYEDTGISFNAYPYLRNQHMAYDKYIFFLSEHENGMGGIFDMSQQKLIGYLKGMPSGNINSPPMTHPYVPHFLPARKHSQTNDLVINAALTARKLDTPVIKPNDRGMVVSYEIDVYWN